MITKSRTVALSTTQALTASLVALDTGSASSGLFDVRNNLVVTFEVTYAKGDETSATIVVEGTVDEHSNGSPVWLGAEPTADLSGSLTAGVFTTPAGYRERTLDTTGVYPVTVDAAGFKRLRVRALATGGTPTGTMALRAVGVSES